MTALKTSDQAMQRTPKAFVSRLADRCTLHFEMTSILSVRATRVVAFMLLLSAGIAAGAMSYSFVCKASGRLGRPIRFEFYNDSTTSPKTDIQSFTVSLRTDDDRWTAMWSILSGHGLTKPIEYGVTPPGFTTMIKPQKLIPGRVYSASATDGQGGSSSVTFGFGKDGEMVYPDSFDE